MKTLQTLAQVEALLAEQERQGRTVFVRFSRGPKVDAQRGYSINYATGRAESGLSCETLSVPEWWPVNGRTPAGYIKMQLASYAYMRYQGLAGTYGWVLVGTECGRGSDNEPIVSDWTPLARLAPALVEEVAP